jgi:hypothetical protein
MRLPFNLPDAISTLSHQSTLSRNTSTFTQTCTNPWFGEGSIYLVHVHFTAKVVQSGAVDSLGKSFCFQKKNHFKTIRRGVCVIFIQSPKVQTKQTNKQTNKTLLSLYCFGVEAFTHTRGFLVIE